MALDPITMMAIGQGVSALGSAVGGLFGARRAKRKARKARQREKRARVEMRRLEDIYSNIDTSNPYLNMENTMEDLTINQQQAQFEAQQFQQSQANILGSLRGAAGGSGIASLAQQLAQSGQLQAQRASASIGAQEAANQRLSRQQAANIQAAERRGEITSRQQQRNQVGTLLGMRQNEAAAAREQRSNAQVARQEAIGGAVGGLFDLAGTAATSGVFGGGSNPATYDGGQLDTVLNPSVFSQFPFQGVTQTYDEYDQGQYNQIMNVANQYGMK